MGKFSNFLNGAKKIYDNLKKQQKGWYTVDMLTVHTTPAKKYKKHSQKESESFLFFTILNSAQAQ